MEMVDTMADGLVIKAPAKINLTLDVLGKRADGYHELLSIMQLVSLYDEITISILEQRSTRATDDHIRISTNLRYLPTDKRNLAYIAAQRFFECAGITPPLMQIDIRKRIPVAAGLAGGSTDAAAVLRGLAKLYPGKVARKQLVQIAATLGADVPFCLLGGIALAQGIGDVLTPLPDLPRCTFVIAKPDVNLSTKWVFQNYSIIGTGNRPDTNGAIQAIQARDIRRLAKCMGNVLESVSVEKHPVIREIKSCLLQTNALSSLMSGSGPSVFGVFKNNWDASKGQQFLRELGFRSFLAHPLRAFDDGVSAPNE
jgi:4-diphosphocytidyl-2-C-methyl-D-erythritol kinase